MSDQELINKYNNIRNFFGDDGSKIFCYSYKNNNDELIYDFNKYNELGDEEINFINMLSFTDNIVNKIKMDNLNKEIINVKSKKTITSLDNLYIKNLEQEIKSIPHIESMISSENNFVSMYMLPNTTGEQRDYLNEVHNIYKKRYNPSSEAQTTPITLEQLYGKDSEYKVGFVSDNKEFVNEEGTPIGFFSKNPNKTIYDLLKLRKDAIKSNNCKYDFINQSSEILLEKKADGIYSDDDVKKSCNSLKFNNYETTQDLSGFFNSDNNIDYDELMVESFGFDRNNFDINNINLKHSEKQFVFGFSRGIDKYTKCNKLFNANIMIYNKDKTSCNPLIEWSPMLNLLITLCSVHSDSPLIRFILPNNKIYPDRYPRVQTMKEVYSNTPVGVLTIRFTDPRPKKERHPTIRYDNDYGTIFVYIFHSNKLHSDDLYHNVSPYLYYNGRSLPVTPYTALSDFLSTYYEFDQLICYLGLYNYVYRNKTKGTMYNRNNEKELVDILFIDHHGIQNSKLGTKNGIINKLLEKGMIEKVQYYCFKANPDAFNLSSNINSNENQFINKYIITKEDENSKYIPDSNSFFKYNQYIIKKYPVQKKSIDYNKLINCFEKKCDKIIMFGGKGLSYNLLLTSEFKLFDENIASKYYKKFFDTSFELFNTTVEMLKMSFHINKYEFIQPQNISTETPKIFSRTKEDRIYKASTILDVNQPYVSIVKYRPLIDRFYFYYEIIKSFDIIKDNDNILFMCSCSPSFLEACNYYSKTNISLNLLYFSHYSYLDDDKTKKMLQHINQFININTTQYNKPIDMSFFDFTTFKKYNVICTGFFIFIDSVDYDGIFIDIYNTPFFLAHTIYALKNLIIGGNYIINFTQLRTKANADIVLICKSLFEETHLYHPQIHNIAKFSGTVAVFKGFKGINDSEINKLIDLFNQYYKYDNNLTDKFNVQNEKLRKILRTEKPYDTSYEHLYINGFLNTTSDQHEYNFIYNFNKQLYMKKIHFIKKIERIQQMNEIEQKSYFEKTRKKQLVFAVLYATKFGLDHYNFDTNFVDEYMERTILQHMYSIDMPLIYTFEHSLDQVDKTGITPFFLNYKKQVFMNDFLIDTRNLDEWDRVKKEVRYYSPVEKFNNLKNIVAEKFKIKASQAWLKMYELIVDNHLITQESGTYKSFHLCEAPGNFIAALNHYIKSETKLKFEWKAQSLNPNKVHEAKSAFGDEYGYIANYPDNWIWGADDTGDITKEINIRFYKKYCTDVQLMTSDCGLPYDREDTDAIKLIKVHYAQIVFILHCLPIGGDFIVKLYMPTYSSLQISIIYLIYNLFESVTFYKGVVNTFSKEYYMIGKGYKGIEPKMEQKLFDILNNFTFNVDLYDNVYNEDFIFQLEYVLQKIFDNYKFTFHRQLFYVDNMNYINDRYLKKIKGAIKNKNYAWIKRMHLKQINRNDVL